MTNITTNSVSCRATRVTAFSNNITVNIVGATAKRQSELVSRPKTPAELKSQISNRTGWVVKHNREPQSCKVYLCRVVPLDV